VAQGVPGSSRPWIFPDIRYYKGGKLSAICTSRLYPRRNPWYSFSGAESTPGHMVVSGGTMEKIPSDTTRDRSWDLTSSAAPYPLRYPRPQSAMNIHKQHLYSAYSDLWGNKHIPVHINAYVSNEYTSQYLHLLYYCTDWEDI
jgi:hypothetical protein